MKKSPAIPPRALIALGIVALLLIALVWQQNKKADNPTPTTSSPPRSTTASENRRHTGSQRTSNTAADNLLRAEGARTDVTVSTFPAKAYRHLPQPGGKAAGAPAAQAYIHIPSASRRIAMEPNPLGEFPTIETKLNDTVGVRLSLEEVKPGTPVRIVILDGGTFPTTRETVAQVLESTTWGGTAFEFITSGNVGTHRILVQAQGHPARILNFNAYDPNNWPAPSTASTH